MEQGNIHNSTLNINFIFKTSIMIRIATLFLILISFGFMAKQPKEKIVFFGDSITELGVQPKGYISIMKDKINQNGLADQYELAGAGIGGNKVYDLYLRMEDDVLIKNPNTVVIWIGVNDVWHKKSYGTGTDPDKFERFYNAIIKKLKGRNIKVFLCTPAVIGEKTDLNNSLGLDTDLDKYCGIIRNVASNNHCGLIDLRKAFLQYNSLNNKDNKESGILTVDGVHLNDKGNELVADEMMKVLIR
jgi:lysophospholipase L1-like esterase